jgi:hypothetical protein
MREDKFWEQDIVIDKYGAPLASYIMSVRDYVLRPDATAGAMTITLPGVVEARGKIYSIIVQYADATNTITIQDNDDSEEWIADLPLTEKGQGILAYSDGRHWTLAPVGMRAASFSTARTDGTSAIRTDVVQLIVTEASALTKAEAFRSTLFADVQVGSWGNAIVGVIDFLDAGHVTGLASPICSELNFPAGAIPGGRGTYWAFEAELNLPTDFVGGGVPIAILGANVWGAEADQFDDSGFLFDITGVTSGSGNFFYDHTDGSFDGWLKCRINGDTKYIPLMDGQAA